MAKQATKTAYGLQDLDIDQIIDKLLAVKGNKPGK